MIQKGKSGIARPDPKSFETTKHALNKRNKRNQRNHRNEIDQTNQINGIDEIISCLCTNVIYYGRARLNLKR